MTIEQAILKEVQALTPEKQREIYEHARRLRVEGEKRPPFKSVRGLWAHLGVSISAEEIEQNQREMWRNFPREDI